jgi:hypothetical protein
MSPAQRERRIAVHGYPTNAEFVDAAQALLAA